MISRTKRNRLINNIDDTDVSILAHKKKNKTRINFIFLFGIFFFSLSASVSLGAVDISLESIFAIILERIGIESSLEYSKQHEMVILGIRLPRTILGVLVGAALAASGAALQGIFRNPLADPALIGVSTGAALAAVSVIVLGGNTLIFNDANWTPFIIPLAAFFGGIISTFIVYRISNRDGQTDISTMLLAGVALNAITSAGIGLLIFLSDDQQLRDLNFWLLGSLAGITWIKVMPLFFLILAPLTLLIFLSRNLNALLLGEREAFHMGFSVESTKILIILTVALLTGASVAITGIIGFIGLVTPHLIRILMGSDNKIVLPGSIILGATLIVIADIVSRFVVLPAELPIGIVTSCVGGPFFLWLLIHNRSKVL